MEIPNLNTTPNILQEKVSKGNCLTPSAMGSQRKERGGDRPVWSSNTSLVRCGWGSTMRKSALLSKKMEEILRSRAEELRLNVAGRGLVLERNNRS